jgi:two-component sensor histidine kinase
MAAQAPIHPEVAQRLALAMVASANAPLLLLDGDLNIIAASTSFGRAFQIDPAAVVGRQPFALGTGEWDVPQLRALLAAAASGQAKGEMDLNVEGRPARRLVLNARQLVYAEESDVRLLLTICDVTDARIAAKLKDDLLLAQDHQLRDNDSLLRKKDILLQEIQHRVANSLQIVASVLRLSARNVRSDETRAHLLDAHGRVMSVALVQRQLTAGTSGDVELRAYFTDLCRNLEASMISDHDQLSLEVSVDATITTADTSVSLGLIVTELVINALKHAFPDRRTGRIIVDYRSEGPHWTLRVGDDGVGMSGSRHGAEPGLGTNIVETLASQLRARVVFANSNPGTSVSVVHP